MGIEIHPQSSQTLSEVPEDIRLAGTWLTTFVSGPLPARAFGAMHGPGR